MGEQVAESLQMDCKSLSIFLLYLSATGMGKVKQNLFDAYAHERSK